MEEHHSKELREELWRHWQQECKSTEARTKDEYEKKVEWFKENRMVEKANQKLQISHMKETMNIK